MLARVVGWLGPPSRRCPPPAKARSAARSKRRGEEQALLRLAVSSGVRVPGRQPNSSGPVLAFLPDGSPDHAACPGGMGRETPSWTIRASTRARKADARFPRAEAGVYARIAGARAGRPHQRLVGVAEDDRIQAKGAAWRSV